MEDKYYLPKIEEFCVGFEYEQHEIINERDPHWKMMVKKIGFSKKEINQIFYSVDLVENLDQKRIRVKYLDSSDIESFGFKFIKIGWTESSMIFRNNRACGYEIYFRDDYTLHISKSSGITLFEGKIKNKSELKKLLIQLEIINE